MPVIVTAPAARALRRREREESLSVIRCLIQAIPSVSTVRRESAFIRVIISVWRSMWTSRAAEPATAERPPVLLFRKSKSRKSKSRKRKSVFRLDKCSETADNRASDRIRRETAGT